MKKPVPKMTRITLPALLCCLPLQAALAEVAAPPSSASCFPRAVALADVSVSGKVVDSKGEGLPGVTVLVKGTSTGTSTNADGTFLLIAPAGSTLSFSYVGYIRKEVTVTEATTTLNVALAEDVNALSEVVVVGYLQQDRQNVTSAVSSVDTREAAKAPVPTLSQAIQGRVAGVQVLGSGAPGAVPNIAIRGIGSVNAGSQPLYVIDGLWTDNIRDLSPNDIETATVLKDASSTAVYGSRGANGVILITTKRGQAGEPKISFNGYTGVESIYKRYELTNHSEWADRATTAYLNAGLDPRVEMPGAVKGTPAYSDAIDTDWQKEFFRDGKVQDYNLSFSGGSSSGKNATNFLISGGYFNQEGIVKGPKFERYSVRLNSGLTRGRLKVGQSLLVTHINTTLLNEAPFIDVLTELPGIPVYNPANVGGFGYGSANLFNYSVNPIGAQEILNRTQKNNRLQGSANADFAFTDFLSYRLNMGLEVHDYNDKDFRKNGFIRLGESSNPNNTFLFENRGTAMTTLIENTLNFNKRFGEHGISAVIGYSEQTFNANNATARNTLFLSQPQYFPVLSAGTAPNGTVSGVEDEYNKRSYFSQLNYDFKNRYLLTASFRRDGSSRFARSNQYGNFGAGSVGWRISEEDFFKNALPLVSNLKLRASYGVNGNDNLPGSYLYQATINQNVSYPLGATQTFVNGAIQLGLESQNIRWESRYTSNVGFDLALLEDRVTLSADYYTSTTKNALVNPRLPDYLGTAASISPFTNLGEIQNRGFEFALGYHENRSAFTYGADLTLTTLKNEVLKLSELQPNVVGPFGVTRTQVGQPIGRLYLVEMLGIFQSQEEIDNYKNAAGKVIQPLAKPGDVKYKDLNGDGQISADTDREFVGNPFPTLQFGLNLTAGYKGFDLSVFLQGVTGNEIYNNTRAVLDQLNGVNNYRRDLSPWTPQNPSTTTPRLVQGGGLEAVNNNNPFTTRWVEDGSYLRLRNVQLGYTFPKSLTSKVPSLGSVRVYVTGRNVFTVTKYIGFDPETPGLGVYGPGIDSSSYPNVRAFTGGVQVNF
ncbi:SusC/RagA family TonB-linked outer membrane protein [Hymenobacter metallicola]|uniref:TonB-dependent receptor n=1 Tax=Hymenobacter metallicola TaxID=2563114 RepID=A0A4Z0QIT6_9BACT|nr:TonB-dependent receptor [Hymenobacter metallicola]TGE29173.1 TonB-dependent receptor [Hymenobacter metallicola]